MYHFGKEEFKCVWNHVFTHNCFKDFYLLRTLQRLNGISLGAKIIYNAKQGGKVEMEIPLQSFSSIQGMENKDFGENMFFLNIDFCENQIFVESKK